MALSFATGQCVLKLVIAISSDLLVNLEVLSIYPTHSSYSVITRLTTVLINRSDIEMGTGDFLVEELTLNIKLFTTVTTESVFAAMLLDGPLNIEALGGLSTDHTPTSPPTLKEVHLS